MRSKNERGLGPLPDSIVVFALIIVISIGSIYLYSEVIEGTSEDGQEKFTSENYGFSFRYPSNWVVENQKNPYTGSLMVMARENVTENVNDPKAGFQINVGSLGITSVENFKNNFLTQVENNDNISKIEGPTDVTRGGLNGFNLTLSMDIEQGQFESRYLLLMGEGTQYWINSYLQEEGSEVDFEDEINDFFESFTIQ